MALGRLFVWLGLDKKDYEAGLKGASASAAVHTRGMQGNFDRLNFKRMRLDWVQTSRVLNFVGVGLAARMMFKEFEKVEGVIALKNSFQGLVDVFVEGLTPAINMATKAFAEWLDLGEKGGPTGELSHLQADITLVERKIKALKLYKQWDAVAIQEGRLADLRAASAAGSQRLVQKSLTTQAAAKKSTYGTKFDFSRMPGIGGRAMPKLRGGADNVFEAALGAKGRVGAGRKLVPAEISPEMLDRLSYTLDEKVEEMEGRFNDFSGNVQASWTGAMQGMKNSSMDFRDFAKEMFRGVESAFFDMVFRMASKKFFDATLGKWAEKAPLSVQDALKYRTPGSNVLRGSP